MSKARNNIMDIKSTSECPVYKIKKTTDRLWMFHSSEKVSLNRSGNVIVSWNINQKVEKSHTFINDFLTRIASNIVKNSFLFNQTYRRKHGVVAKLVSQLDIDFLATSNVVFGPLGTVTWRSSAKNLWLAT